MASQSDYANVVMALSTLAQAPVAAYPDSGPMMLAQQGQDRAAAKLADEAMKKAQKKAKKKGTLGTIGQIGGMAAGALLAAPTGGMSMLAGAGLGGSIGGAAGALASGSAVDAPSLASSFADATAAGEGSVQSSVTKRKKPLTYNERKVPSQYDSWLPDGYREL